METILLSSLVLLASALALLSVVLVHVRRISRNRLSYIKDCIDLLYVCGKHDADKFYEHCRRMSHIKQLARYRLTSRLPPTWKFLCKWHRLTPAQRELTLLMHAGFSNRELSVIFGVGKVSSIYVKYYRVKCK